VLLQLKRFCKDFLTYSPFFSQDFLTRDFSRYLMFVEQAYRSKGVKLARREEGLFEVLQFSKLV
jgi:hypothetical protein